jgi:hypothetical protein
MSGFDALRMAHENGIRISVTGTDLVLNADQAPPAEVLDALRQHKARIVAILTEARSDWDTIDWRTYFDERAGIAEFDGGLARPEAEARAFKCCVNEWLNCHPEPSDPDSCAECNKPDQAGHAIVPFGAEGYGHTWLHPECWNAWHRGRLEQSINFFATIGLGAPGIINIESKNLD